MVTSLNDVALRGVWFADRAREREPRTSHRRGTRRNTTVPRLFDAGVEVFEYETVMHAKAIIADVTVVIGTINLDAWALYRNHEVAVMFEDLAVAEDARAVLVDDALTRSEPAELEDGIWNRSKDWFWDKLVYFI